MESLYFLLPLFFIVVIILPLNFRIKLCLNVQKEIIYVSIFFWKFKIVLFKIFFKDKNIIITTKKKKKEIEFSLSAKQIYFVEQLTNNLKSKTQIRKICVYGRVGYYDAYKTAMTCATVNSFIELLFCYLKNKKPTCSMENNICPCFNKEILLFSLYTSLTITLFDLLYSVVISLFSLRSKKYERDARKSKIS